ncbi:7TM GPCR domain containing protein [Elysia marginata]|uniref:7TM GPCR domain containing protein n=1 Tax=Elysia marginata TaxID=1093978 RepID=A0AAV4EQJ7_9GAST|nr:7TM GPCR domain containing protein [Elysia marginata]
MDNSVTSSILNTSSLPSDDLLTLSNGSGNISTFPNLELDKGTTKESCEPDEFYISPTIENVAFFTGVFLICENLLMVYIIGRTRALHTNTNILVASLAFTDIMIGTQCFMMGLTGYIDDLRSLLRRRPTQNRLFHSVLTSLVLVSISHLAVLSVDRYLFVLWPFRYPFRITERRVLIIAVGIWILGLTYMAFSVVVYLDPNYQVNCLVVDAPFAYGDGPLLCVYFMCLVVLIASTSGLSRLALAHTRKREMLEGKDIQSDHGKRKGEIERKQDVYSITSGVVESLTLQTISVILHKAAKETRHINLSDASVMNVHETNPEKVSSLELKERYQHHTQVQRKTNLFKRTKLKILKFVLVILGCYLVCSIPSVLRITIKTILRTDYLSGTVDHVAGLMLVANSGMNFFIMVQLNRDFRAALSQTSSSVKCSCRK